MFSKTSLDFLILAALSAATFFVAITLGAPHLSSAQIVNFVAAQLHLPTRATLALSAQQAASLWTLRLPRALAAAIGGAALGIGAASTQGIYRSPLADPGLFGGLSVGALGFAGALRLTGLSPHTGFGANVGTLSAALCAYAALWAVERAAQLRGQPLVTMMLLVGLGVGAAAGALSATLGGVPRLATAGTAQLLLGGVLLLGAMALLMALGGRLDALQLGDQQACTLGIDGPQTRRLARVGVAMSVGVAVGVGGPVAYLGLMAAHLARSLVGARSWVRGAAAALVGATLLMWVDVIARSAAMGHEWPTQRGATLIAAPYFIWLLLGARQRWAAP